MLSVLKIGGSVLRDEASYAAAARFSQDRLAADPGERLVVIVSAQYGATDELLAEARSHRAGPVTTTPWICCGPPASCGPSHGSRCTSSGSASPRFPSTSTRPASSPAPSQVEGPAEQRTTVRPLRLLAALGASRIVIVPGFLGVSAGGTITSLGRGGSDLTAVLLAIAVRADACELIKDVPGYFTADPHRDAEARPIHDLPIDEALAHGRRRLRSGAARGARRRGAGRPASGHPQHGRCGPRYHVHSVSRKDRSKQHGVRHQDDSRRAAVGA